MELPPIASTPDAAAHEVALWIWLAFIGAILAIITADLLMFHRRPGVISMRSAMRICAFWIGLAAVVGLGVWQLLGAEAAIQYATAYVVEESLSVDNVFVFAVIFQRMGVSRDSQPRVLFWGIIGAIILRGLCIAGGLALLNWFAWIMYVFGAILLWTGWKMLQSAQSGPEFSPENSRILRIARRFLPISAQYEGSSFLVRENGRWLLTPLLLVLLVVDFADVIFAVDSIPAVMGVTQIPFVVFSSNIMAILGLRALYFAVAGLLERFHMLHFGLAVIVAFIGVKLILGTMQTSDGHPVMHLTSAWTLSIVASVLLISMGASLVVRNPSGRT